MNKVSRKKYYEVDFNIWDKEEKGEYPRLQAGSCYECQGRLTEEEYEIICSFIGMILKNKRRRKA